MFVASIQISEFVCRSVCCASSTDMTREREWGFDKSGQDLRCQSDRLQDLLVVFLLEVIFKQDLGQFFDEGTVLFQGSGNRGDETGADVSLKKVRFPGKESAFPGWKLSNPLVSQIPVSSRPLKAKSAEIKPLLVPNS